MKLKIFLITAALLMNAPCITHAADGKEKLQGRMINVSMHNKTDYIVKAYLKKHQCMYDVNKNRNFALAPGASATVRAETKRSGWCGFVPPDHAWMLYEFTVAVPNKSPIRIGECLIKLSKRKGSGYRWGCKNQRVRGFYIETTSSNFLLLIGQRR